MAGRSLRATLALPFLATTCTPRCLPADRALPQPGCAQCDAVNVIFVLDRRADEGIKWSRRRATSRDGAAR